MILDLIGQDVTLKKITSTEWAGPCPWCGGIDRLHVWPGDDAYKCMGYEEGRNGCGKHGDSIQWLRDHRKMSFQDAAALVGKVLEYADAKIRGQYNIAQAKRQAELKAPEATSAPMQKWADKAWAFLWWSHEQLDSEAGNRAEYWLAQRGLSVQTMQQFGLGYCPKDIYTSREDWGLGSEQGANGKMKQVWCPRGIVIPWLYRGELWRIRFRRPLTTEQAKAGEAKYFQLPGCGNGLYQAGLLAANRPAILVESELDALLLGQECGDLAACIATGGTAGARRAQWIALLALCSVVLIAYDADEAGQKAAHWWKDALPNGRIWRPLWGDQTDMARDGANLRQWVEGGIL